MHRFRLALCLLALAASAPRLEAQRQCGWEPVRARRESDARRDSIWNAAREGYRADVLRAAAGAGIAEPRGVVFFSMEPDGSAPAVRAIESNVPEALLTPLIAGMVERAKPHAREFRGRVTVVARLDTLPRPAVRADGKRLECRPIILNPVQAYRQLEEWAMRQGPGLFSASASMVSVVVGRDGRAIHVELQRASGNKALDEISVELAWSLLFRPASEDGVEQDVVSVLPVRVLAGQSPFPERVRGFSG